MLDKIKSCSCKDTLRARRLRDAMISRKLFQIVAYANEGNYWGISKTASMVLRHVKLLEGGIPDDKYWAIETSMLCIIMHTHNKDVSSINRAIYNLLYTLYPGEVLMANRLKKSRPTPDQIGSLDGLPNSVLCHIADLLVPKDSAQDPSRSTAAKKLIF